MNSPAEKFATPQQELSYIAQESQRQYALQEQPHKTLEAAAEHTIQQYAQAEAKDFLHEARVLPEHEAERIVLKLKPESHDSNIEELFGVMLEHGIKNALDVARKTNNPHIEKDFHRFLVQYLRTIGAIPGIAEQSKLHRELSHTLFTISLPPHDEKDNASTFKTFIQAMKQFYAGMLAIVENDARYYTLELAVGHNSRDIMLYASVPNDSEDTFEKLVHAYYPGAAIEEAPDDYNIFSGNTDVIAGSIASLANEPIFPLSTDAVFEHDPLGALIGSLSQMEKDGEGAAIQVVISADTEGTNNLITRTIEKAEHDHQALTKAYKELNEGILVGLGKGLISFFDEPKDKDKAKEKPIDSKNIELAKKKNESYIIRANIRLVAAAQNKARADRLIATMKASFAQFALVESNSIKWRDIDTSDLIDFAHDVSFRTLQEDQNLLLSINELATLFHFPVGLLTSPELKETKAATSAAPANIQPGGVYLGTNSFRGQETPIYLGKEDRVRHCYVIGQTGTGKTTILKNMAIQDIANGNGICFMDPHGSDLQDILANIPKERLDDVIYFDPAYTERPMGLNMLEFDARFPEQKIFVINELLSIFNKLFDMKTSGGPMFEQYFRNAAGLVMEHPESGSTLLEIGRVMSDSAFRKLKLSHCKNPLISQFWENAEKTTGESSLANFVPYITNKFDVFISNDIMRPVVAQQHSVLNFREIMDTKKILLVNLSKGRLGDINSHLIGLVLVGKITMAALSRVDMVGKGAINDFYLYIDEFQNVTTDSIATILSEARKYRLGLIIAHQYVEQLEESIKSAVFGNVGSMIIYRVSTENAAIFEKQLQPTFTAPDIIKLENFNAYAKILVKGVPEKPFNLRIPPPPQGNMAIADKVKELSYLKYGRPRQEVEEEIMSRFNAPQA